ncbi:immunoglobulin variable region used by the itc63b heavy chain [Fusarium sporotrichioides]|uniref:Immunoglobulin variable region used by the itc63b heavy chain n=1 Tax=Fusarium sporotrichioides TaxID=5514 RepID=A0A395RKH1_FUSSP|nr:immunoglobulin variable region used by the itc63b heavy chain [Fusarium sporotrichioides]
MCNRTVTYSKCACGRTWNGDPVLERCKEALKNDNGVCKTGLSQGQTYQPPTVENESTEENFEQLAQAQREASEAQLRATKAQLKAAKAQREATEAQERLERLRAEASNNASDPLYEGIEGMTGDPAAIVRAAQELMSRPGVERVNFTIEPVE